jgi:DNA repair photolyase
MCLIISRSIQASSYFATKWVNTKLLDYVPENKIRVRMSLMPEKMRAILENGTSPIIKKSSVPGEAFPSRILYAHQFQSNYLPRQKTERVQRTLQHH